MFKGWKLIKNNIERGATANSKAIFDEINQKSYHLENLQRKTIDRTIDYNFMRHIKYDLSRFYSGKEDIRKNLKRLGDKSLDKKLEQTFCLEFLKGAFRHYEKLMKPIEDNMKTYLARGPVPERLYHKFCRNLNELENFKEEKRYVDAVYGLETCCMRLDVWHKLRTLLVNEIARHKILQAKVEAIIEDVQTTEGFDMFILEKLHYSYLTIYKLACFARDLSIGPEPMEQYNLETTFQFTY